MMKTFVKVWRSDRNFTRALAAVAFVMAILAYSPTLLTAFIWDAIYVYEGTLEIQDLKNLQHVFSTPTVVNNEGNGDAIGTLGYFRPLTKAWYIVGYSVFGENPFGYKLASLLLHGLVSVLAFYLVLSISSQPLVAAGAALLFAVNPIHTEVVVWTYSVSYLLVAVFSFLTLLLYRRGLRILAFAAFCMALLSHEIGVLVLPVLVLYRWLLEDDKRWSGYVSLVPYAVALVLFLLLRQSVVGSIPLANVGSLEFVNTAAIVTMRYLKIFFWPDAAVTLYPYEKFSGFSLELVVAYMICASLLALAYLYFRRDRESLFWLLWFGTWISVSFNSGSTGEYLMAEKILYLASIGICTLLVRTAIRLFNNRLPWVLFILLTVASIQTYETWHRVAYWKDTPTYLEAALEHAPGFYLALYQLSLFAIDEQDFDKARRLLHRAVDSRPTFSPAINNLANTLYLDGRLDDAVILWKRALEVDPTNPMPYFNIGLALNQLGDREQSREFFDEYMKHEPNPPIAVLMRLRSLGY